MTYHTHYKRGGTHKMNTPGCRRHKRKRLEAEGVQQLAARALHKTWRERPQGRILPAREAEAAREVAAHDLTVFTEVDETQAHAPRNGDAYI
jgi:hypothetical protein